MCLHCALSDEWSALAASHLVQPIPSEMLETLRTTVQVPADKPCVIMCHPMKSWEVLAKSLTKKTHLIQKQTKTKDGFATNRAELLQIV